ncbi:MAG: transporter substrate-binding domain-containing protein [Spirochaetota bacterium]
MIRFSSSLRRLLVLVSVFLFAAVCSVAAQAVESYKTEGGIVLAGAEFGYPPYSIVDDEGEADGFSVELMRESLQAMGYDVHFKVGQWEAVKQDLEQGEIEALPLVGRTPEREDVFDFTFPYLTMHGVIVVHEDTSSIHKLEDLSGKTIAVMSGDNAEEFSRRNLSDTRIVGTADFSEALRLLSDKQVDAVIIQRLVALQLIQELGITDVRLTGTPIMDFKQSFSFAVQEGNRELLAVLNEGLSIVIANRTYDELYTKWFGPLQSFSREYDRVIIGGDKSYPPYEFLDENGEPAGFNVDLTQAIAEELGIEFEIVLDDWAVSYQKLLDGEVDLLQGVYYSIERDEYLSFSQPYTVVRHVIVTRDNEFEQLETLEDLRGLEVLVMENDIMHDKAVEMGFDSELQPVQNQEEALRRLAEGEADCALVAEMPASYWIGEHGWDNLVIGEQIMAPDYGYASLENEESILHGFSEVMHTLMTDGTYRDIRNKWFQVYEQDQVLEDILRILWVIAIPVVLIILLILLWIYLLRRKVHERTHELRDEVLRKEAAEQKILAERERLSITLRSIGDGVITTDTDGRIELINRVAEELTGWNTDEAMGQPLEEVFHIVHEYTGKTCENPVKKVIETGEVVELANHTMLISKNGNRYIIEDSGAPIRDYQSRIVGVVLVFRDMTEEYRLKERMQQTAKLDSIGVLAGGIAHDFNNLLSGIFGYVELAKEAHLSGEDCISYLDEALAIFNRARHLTQQLLTFSKGGHPKRETKDISKLIKNSVSFALSGSNVVCSYEFGDDLWMCDVDENQIGQVFDNIVINAKQAMSGGGAITIAARNELIDHSRAVPLLRFGEYVHITVTDTGIGIPEKILDRVFDPFFTTKQEGNGLGLATCYSIISKHQGTIYASSIPGEGTTFHIYLPKAQSKQSHAPVYKPTQHTGTGNILVMDDEQFMRALIKHMLESMGYTVIEAASGEQAVSACIKQEGDHSEDEQQSIGLTAVFLDLTVPGGMGGKEVIGDMRRLYPDIPIFASSGYSEDEVMSDPARFSFTASIAKPFSREELARLLERYLPKTR